MLKDIVDKVPEQADRNVLMAEAGYRLVAKMLMTYEKLGPDEASGVAEHLFNKEMAHMLDQGWVVDHTPLPEE